ncbi:helix-turn-helix domain-containing protein [Alkalicoccus urumqiensis]|uniref:AraC family transcriptional regulator n=1 Tax=Alkalicoccus urumqiensis TaxID=1548213 RepID=A0A2P6MLH7_ALKUR|nr:AraC family transcriptional regulator [Alkalicoccus urumqiensis]PRO67132.1 AraC family transcriptional regulator [Alkalicoccus urumqiensis]
MIFFEHHGMEEDEYFRVFPLRFEHFPLHFHRAFELIFVEQGTASVFVDQQEYDVSSGEAVFVFPHQLHAITTSGGAHVTVLLFSPEVIGHFFVNLKGRIPTNNVIPFRRLPDQGEEDAVYAQKAFLYDLCDTLVRQSGFTDVKYSPKTKIIHRMLHFIDVHFHETCTLQAVAEELQYDYAYLSKLFLQMTNMTFTWYVNHYRTAQACYLLKTTQKPVGEIAADCGYTTMRSFHRNFHRMMHTTPGRYRGHR